MINIDEIKKFVEFIANKSQAGVNPTPDRFNIAAKRALTEWISHRYNNPQSYLPNSNKPKIGYQMNQKITDDLKFLIVPPSVYQVGADGKLSYPADYLHVSSIRYKHKKLDKTCGEIITKEVDVKDMKDSEIGHILTSSIVNPTKRYPYCSFYDTYIQLYPKDLGSVVFTYLRKPKDPKWAYTVSNGRPVYNPTNSVDIEAPEEAMNEIAVRILSFLGIHIREPQLVQYAELLKEKGV